MRISDWSSDVCSSDLCRSESQVRNEDGHREANSRQEGSSGQKSPIEPVTECCNTEAHCQPSEQQHTCRLTDNQPREDGSGNPLVQIDSRKCDARSEEHTSELQSLMRISYAVFCLK